jgi:hypothetical protein
MPHENHSSSEKVDTTSMHLEGPQDLPGKLESAATLDDPREDPDWQNVQRSLVRKLDMTLLPMLWVLYMFNYLDRNNIA